MAISILLVDDDAGFRSLAASMLRAAGHGGRIHEAGTVADALSVAATLTPDVALVDVGLPDGDGLQLTGRLASLPNPPRVVLISADADAIDEQTARRAGAVGFVAKEQLTGARLQELVDQP